VKGRPGHPAPVASSSPLRPFAPPQLRGYHLVVSLQPALSCLNEETLAALVAGQLDAPDMAGVEAHLAACADCRGIAGDAAHGMAEPSLSTSLAPASSGLDELVPGYIVASKYVIDGILGRGGMGLVFSARHLELGHRVAIKVVNSSDRTAVVRFLREAKTCARLDNEHVARVFDLGRLPNGLPYFVMEHLVGEDLGRRIARGPIPLALALEYVMQACVALRDAHAAGVIHRDLKPANLFIVQRSDGKPWLKVLDFGVSKLVTARGGDTSSGLTLSQSILGSPLYMSPEQIRASKVLDARSDIWSLGVILYELSTGKRPFSGAILSAVLVSIATEAPRTPSAISPGLPSGMDAIVLRCLEKDPAARFQSMQELFDALAELDTSTLAPGHPVVRQARAIVQRHRRAAIAVAAVCLAALTAVLAQRAGCGLERSPNSRPAPPPSRVELAHPAHPAQPASPAVTISCDRPLPNGSIEVSSAGGSAEAGAGWARRLPIARLCDSSSSDAGELEWVALLRGAPALTTAALTPSHPFYSIDWENTPAQLTFRLRRAQHARVSFVLSGVTCKDVLDMSVRTVDAPREAAVAAVAEPGDPCLRHVTLPFESFGKRSTFRFRPSRYSADEAVLGASRINLDVRRARRPRGSPTEADPCVSPHFYYCQD
jgi:eukaryotic-like serine/threonine-protein kinase